MSSQGDGLTAKELEELKGYIDKLGERKVRQHVGLSAATLARTVARLPVQRGSVAMVRHGLEELRGTEAP